MESKCYMCYQGVAASHQSPFILGDAIRQRIEGVRHVRRGRVCTRHIVAACPSLAAPLQAGRMFCEHRVDAVV